MDWTVLSFDENFLKRHYQLNRFLFRSKFSKRAIWFQPYSLLIKIFQKGYMHWTALYFGQNFLKGQYGWNRIQNFKKKNDVGWTIVCFGQNFLKRLSRLNHIVIWSKVLEGQRELNHIVFWSKFSKKTLSVEPYSLFVEIF